MVAHVEFKVSDYVKSKNFYEQALAPLGIKILFDEKVERSAGFGIQKRVELLIQESNAVKPVLHIAFLGPSRQAVEEFYKMGLSAGGRDNGAPGLRPHYHKDYYAAFLFDPDGHNIEAVCYS